LICTLEIRYILAKNESTLLYTLESTSLFLLRRTGARSPSSDADCERLFHGRKMFIIFSVSQEFAINHAFLIKNQIMSAV
jgi:hypothetical protein